MTTYTAKKLSTTCNFACHTLCTMPIKKDLGCATNQPNPFDMSNKVVRLPYTSISLANIYYAKKKKKERKKQTDEPQCFNQTDCYSMLMLV